MKNNLPTIVPQVIDGVEVNAINARELWENLEIQTPFHKWIQRRLDDSMFVEGQDFVTMDKNVRGGKQVDYIISLEMAKHLAMMEKTGRAFEVRQYFIDAEKKLRQIAVKAPVRLTPAEMLLQQAQLMLEMERKTSELEEGKHFINVTNIDIGGKQKVRMLTKCDVVRLGVFIKTPMAKEFR